MNIVLIGGFFGSGKTTILNHLIQELLAEKMKICIIENEIGEYSIDDLILQSSDIEMVTIAGGCVCCQVTVSLIDAIQQLEQKINPDWIFVELTGIAFLNPLRNVLLECMEIDCPILCISVIDAARWSVFYRAAAPIMIRQVEGGDIIVVNKADLNPDVVPIYEDIHQIGSKAKIFTMSATANDTNNLLQEIRQEAKAYVREEE